MFTSDCRLGCRGAAMPAYRIGTGGGGALQVWPLAWYRSAMTLPMPIVAGRSCGPCTLCCRLPEIDAFDKPADAWCTHCVAGKGCSIYADRPSVCRDFLCLWMTSEDLGAEWEPARSHMMIYGQGPQITVLADPDHPDLWRSEPYHAQLKAWAKGSEAAGGYVIVFWRDEVHKI